VRESRRGSSFTGDSEYMLSKALEMDICFSRGPDFGEKWKVTFLGPMRERINFL
jgi:hypothetical protein